MHFYDLVFVGCTEATEDIFEAADMLGLDK